MIEFKCKECGKICYAKFPSNVTKFCSRKCVAINRERNKRIFKESGKKNENEYVKCICATCGKEFLIEKYKINNKDNVKKYCSRECVYNKPHLGQYVKCLNCGKDIYVTKKKQKKFCSHKCSSQYRYKDSIQKYVSFSKTRNGETRKMHRIIMEEYLGRKLTNNEVVHHINGIKNDNRIENLQVMTKSEHLSFHRNKEKNEGKYLFGRHEDKCR